MNTDLDCLSLMELLELREVADDPTARRHLEQCPRCQALLASLPENIVLPTLPPAPAAQTAIARPPAPDRTRTGSLWRALPDAKSDFAWVVALIGRSPDADDRLLAAPVAAPPALATDTDLVLDANVLGYDAFVDVANLGTLLRSQLVEPVGDLERPAAEALVALYRHVTAGQPAPDEAPRGLPVLDEYDPRLLERTARADSLRALWRPALRLVEDAPALTLYDVLIPHFEGADAAWDRASLLETTGVEGAHLSGFFANRLQLTDKTDVADLACVIHALQIGWSQAEPAVACTLAMSAGGTRTAEGLTERMAARSRAGADEQATTRDLYAGQTAVDTSAAARTREIRAYLIELRRALDELE